MDPLFVVLLIGAAVRLTRLITTDELLEPVRGYVERRLPSSLAYPIRCDWCMSVWVGFPVFVFGWYAPNTIAWIASGALTSSLVAGWAMLVYDVTVVRHTAAIEASMKDFPDAAD